MAYHETGYGASLESIREVWAATTFLCLTKGSCTIREIHTVSGVSSTSVVTKSLRALVQLGYIGRGAKDRARTWNVIVPFMEVI